MKYIKNLVTISFLVNNALYFCGVNSTSNRYKTVIRTLKPYSTNGSNYPPEDNSHYIEAVSKEIWMPLMEESQVELVTLPGPCKTKSYRYFLNKYCNASYVEKELFFEDEDSLTEVLHDRPVLIITHDWRQNFSDNNWRVIRTAAAETIEKDGGMVPILFFDWGNIALYEEYPQTVNMLEEIAHKLTVFVNYFNITVEKAHMIGLGVGAHIVGNSARELKKSDSMVSRVTGLDPAGPMFYNNKKAINMKDAKYVEIIHTDILKLGLFGKELGHGMFLVNGGTANQPGCSHPSCSHHRAYHYFVVTFGASDKKYYGAQCPTNFNFVGPCIGDEHMMGGLDLEKRAKWSPPSSFFWIVIEDKIDKSASYC